MNIEGFGDLPAGFSLADDVLVDGKRRIASCRISQTLVVDGDALSASIVAASIVAKVLRDSLMTQYAQLHPAYGFERHQGVMQPPITSMRSDGSVRCHSIGFRSRLCCERLARKTSCTLE